MSPTKDYKQVIEDTAAMAGDERARGLAEKRGLAVLDLTWEDTARYEGSAVGPNISDMTIQVERRDPERGEHEIRCMPVIRYPNFTDKTGDVPIDRLRVRIGNERGGDLDLVTLRHYLGDLRSYLSDPTSWTGPRRSLLADRDTHVLASAQACFLPVPKEGMARFNPVLFNYQSAHGDPAVLAVLCTREGTSATVIDNTRDGFGAGSVWGQRLFFNKAGQRASLTAERMSDFLAAKSAAAGPGAAASPGAAADPPPDLNMVLLVQVPLKQKNPPPTVEFEIDGLVAGFGPEESIPRGDVEDAVIGHGEVEGPFTEIDSLDIERDPRYPIRVTVQFYKATSNGVVEEADVAAIAAQISRVYADADYVGSLVTDGHTGRPTEWDDEGRGRAQPPSWWDDFWKRHEAATGQSKEDALKALWALTGHGWEPPSAEALAAALRSANP